MDRDPLNKIPPSGSSPVTRTGSSTPLSRPAAAGRSAAAAPALDAQPRKGGGDPRGLVSGILVLSRWIQNMAIGIWLGAILTLGLVAYLANHLGLFKGPVEAGKLIGPLSIYITEFGGICGVVYLLMLLIHDPLWKRYHPLAANGLLSFLRTIISAGMVGSAGYLLYWVKPHLAQYQQAAHIVNGVFTGGAGRAFDNWHKIYEHVTMGIFIAGIFLMLLTQMSRRRR